MMPPLRLAAMLCSALVVAFGSASAAADDQCVASNSTQCGKSLNLLQSATALSAKGHLSQELHLAAVNCNSGSAQCIVPKGETWLLDSDLDVGELIVHGKFIWDTSKDNLMLKACSIMVKDDGAEFQVGTAANPMENKATIYIKDCNSEANPMAGVRFLAGCGDARIEIHGRPLTKTFTLLAQDASKGSPELVLKDGAQAMRWRVGDEVGVVTTGGDDELRALEDRSSRRHVITAINGRTITIDPPLQAKHLGGMKTFGGKEYEMAAEVVNMHRSVLITGDHDGFSSSGQGFHTMMMPSHGDSPKRYGVMDVRYARLEFCGQLDLPGRYCLHFHLMKHCPSCVFQGNAVVDSIQAGITVHGTHDTLVDSNVLWDNHGVGIYTEDGNEMDNMISNNVVVCSSWDDARNTATCRITWQGGDHRHGGIYAVGKTNSFIGNHIAGWTFSLFTPSGTVQGEAVGKICPQFMRIKEIRGNVAHNNGGSGIYLDNQYPREFEVDEDGFAKKVHQCQEEFTYLGADKGSKFVVEDEFEFYNHAGAVHYSLGDIGFKNLVTIRCGNSVYWKRGKNFADGQLTSKHLEDTTVVDGWLLLPGGPFTFWIKNVKLVGWAHIQAPQHGFAPTMSVQYVLEDMDYSASTARSRLVFGSSGGNPVTMLYLTKDNSIGGYHALVSRYLTGFANVPGCEAAGELWDNGYGCDRSVPVRRLNIWGPDMGSIKLTGPGFDVPRVKPDFWNSEWYDGANAGWMHYDGPDAGQKFTRGGYATPVIAGESYEIQLNWAGSDVVFELSDHLVEEYFGAPEVVYMTLVTPQGRINCEVRASTSRDFLAKYPPEGLLEGKAWVLGDCGEKLRQVTGQPPRVAPTPRPPVANLDWVKYQGKNCYGGIGADCAPGCFRGLIPLADCKRECEEEPECGGIIVTASGDPIGCHLRMNIVPEECAASGSWDLWQLEANGGTATRSTTPRPTSAAPTASAPTTAAPSSAPPPPSGSPAPTTAAPAGASSWQRFEGLNCYAGNGAEVAEGDLVSFTMSLAQCQAACKAVSDCEGVVVVRGEDPGRCWLRKSIVPANCNAGSAWDMYLHVPGAGTSDGFEPVATGGRACRGANPEDNSNSYYSASAASSLDACKGKCRAQGAGCKGIEFAEGSGRCEVWMRPAGIGSSASARGYTCLRYDPAQDSGATPLPEFSPVDGGASRACRGSSASDNAAGNYQVSSAGSLGECKARCGGTPACTGIEYSSGRCEVWTKRIQASKSVSGFTCLKVEGLAPALNFSPVDGGNSRACRGSTANDNSARNYQLSSAGSLDECKAKCSAATACKGVEYSSSGRCELWTKDIQASKSFSGFTCLRVSQ